VGIPTIEIAGGDWAVVRLLNSEQSGSPLTTVWKGYVGIVLIIFFIRKQGLKLRMAGKSTEI
jgi:hypothetical protein